MPTKVPARGTGRDFSDVLKEAVVAAFPSLQGDERRILYQISLTEQVLRMRNRDPYKCLTFRRGRCGDCDRHNLQCQGYSPNIFVDFNRRRTS